MAQTKELTVKATIVKSGKVSSLDGKTYAALVDTLNTILMSGIRTGGFIQALENDYGQGLRDAGKDGKDTFELVYTGKDGKESKSLMTVTREMLREWYKVAQAFAGIEAANKAVITSRDSLIETATLALPKENGTAGKGKGLDLI